MWAVVSSYGLLRTLPATFAALLPNHALRNTAFIQSCSRDGKISENPDGVTYPVLGFQKASWLHYFVAKQK
jgi:hypothetical protein